MLSKTPRFPPWSSRPTQRRQTPWRWPWRLSVAITLGWLTYRTAGNAWMTPDAIVVLGGHEQRERYAAQLAQTHPQLPIWVSSGSPKEYATQIFHNAGINRDRLHLDYQASDTVTNFTTLVEQLQTQGINSIYLVTSNNHMPRARLIGEIVLGSRNIFIKPTPAPSHMPRESYDKLLRDGARAITWLVTGRTGALMGAEVQDRMLGL